MNPPRLSRHEVWARALVVAGLTLFVATVYLVVVLGGGLLIGQTESPHVGLSILATALVAFGFERVQGRLRELVTRLFLGGRQSPYEVLRRFSGAVGGTYASAEVAPRMAQVLTEGTGAEWSQVWLMVHDRPVLAATWPPDADADDSAPTDMEAPGRRNLSVRHADEVLAVLRLQLGDRPMTSVEERLFSGLAAQAGLVLRGVRLRVERAGRLADLSARADELRASRERLVDAQDTARRRLEPDIHDGAQQHLVAMAVNLRLAETVARKSSRRAAGILAAQCDAVDETRRVLTDLSRGIYPRLLTEEGIASALRTALAGGPVPVVITEYGVGRYDRSIEIAVYYCCLEAVQNAGKHSGAKLVTIDLRAGSDRLDVTVEDDGGGFSAPPLPGVGLANMRDRIEGLGGTLVVEATAAGGARVRATVPTLKQSGLPTPMVPLPPRQVR